jgi:hypothetical protein
VPLFLASDRNIDTVAVRVARRATRRRRERVADTVAIGVTGALCTAVRGQRGLAGVAVRVDGGSM